MGKTSDHIERQKAFERVAFTPIMLSLGISEFDMSKEAPDIRFEYENRQIGLEVIDCYPDEFDREKEGAIKSLKTYIKNELFSGGIYGLHSVCLKKIIYEVEKISSVRTTIVKEVVGLISGTYSLEQCEYISHISSLIGKQSKETLVQIAVEGTYMIKTPPVDDILNCIKKKNALYSTYDETLDEIWLLIYIPTNENHYSTKGISTLEGIETEFKRIYISDWRLRGRLIYEQ